MFRNTLKAGTRGIRQFSSTTAKFDLARVSLIGRIGQDLEPQESASNVQYLRYSLAVHTKPNETSWFNIVTFNPNEIEYMQTYLYKGARVYVEADASMPEFEGSRKLQLVQRLVKSIDSKAPAGSAEQTEEEQQ